MPVDLMSGMVGKPHAVVGVPGRHGWCPHQPSSADLAFSKARITLINTNYIAIAWQGAVTFEAQK